MHGSKLATFVYQKGIERLEHRIRLPIRGYRTTGQSLAGYPSAEIRSSELLGSAPLLTPDDCQDRSAQCALWASTGQCASNAAYMHRVCPQSCGIPCLSSATGNYGTSPSGYGLTSSYDPYGLISKYGVGIGSPLLGPTAYTLGTGYGIDSITNPIYRTHGGYGLESLAGSGYGLDSALGSFDLGLSGLGPQYGLSYDSRSGFNNYGLGMMDGLANSYGIDSGYGGDSTAALLSQYAMLSGVITSWMPMPNRGFVEVDELDRSKMELIKQPHKDEVSVMVRLAT
uniref:ShKT domain-containing protein n=1 Tax=Parascaris univalens TaxID=6257 RepID=A0A915BFC1_PARUN